jgi:hypothetical protein
MQASYDDVKRMVERAVRGMTRVENVEEGGILCLIPGYITDTGITGQIQEAYSHMEYLATGKEYQNKYGIGPVADALDKETRIRLMADLSGFEKLIVMTPSAAFLKRLAQGGDGCYFCDLICRALLKGKPVAVYVDFSEDAVANGSRFLDVKDAVETLAKMGAEMVYTEGNGMQEGLTLVTEVEVRQAVAAGQTELICAEGCIVTPQARDTAQEKGVRIKK